MQNNFFSQSQKNSEYAKKKFRQPGHGFPGKFDFTNFLWKFATFVKSQINLNKKTKESQKEKKSDDPPRTCAGPKGRAG